MAHDWNQIKNPFQLYERFVRKDSAILANDIVTNDPRSLLRMSDTIALYSSSLDRLSQSPDRLPFSYYATYLYRPTPMVWSSKLFGAFDAVLGDC